MTSYYASKRQLALMIEDRLKEDGEIPIKRLYVLAQRNWGFGPKLVDKSLAVMADNDRLHVDDLGTIKPGKRED